MSYTAIAPDPKRPWLDSRQLSAMADRQRLRDQSRREQEALKRAQADLLASERRQASSPANRTEEQRQQIIAKQAQQIARHAGNWKGVNQSNWPKFLQFLASYVEAWRLDTKFLARVRKSLEGKFCRRDGTSSKADIPYVRPVAA